MKKFGITLGFIAVLALSMTACVVQQLGGMGFDHIAHIDRIVDGGPFDRSFNQGIYPYKEKEIENWFRSNLPTGTTREHAQNILKSSFTIDLTSGRDVMIERSSSSAGGQNTSITLSFSKGLLRDIEVHQHWAYL